MGLNHYLIYLFARSAGWVIQQLGNEFFNVQVSAGGADDSVTIDQNSYRQGIDAQFTGDRI